MRVLEYVSAGAWHVCMFVLHSMYICGYTEWQYPELLKICPKPERQPRTLRIGLWSANEVLDS